jgi:hypothetical protein
VVPSGPLWQRAPSRDADGRLLSDFVMLIPRLGSAPDLRRERVYAELQGLLRRYRQEVHFADLNLRLNLLWISVDPSPGLIRELVAAIRERIPEAVLIGHNWGTGVTAVQTLSVTSGKRGARLRDRILRRGGRRRVLYPPDNGTR